MINIIQKKIALITGGSGGIGSSTAMLAAKKGYSVCVHFFNNEQRALEITNNIINQGGQAIALQADLSSDNDVKHMFTTVDFQLGTITALVNNAGILDIKSRLDQMDETRLNKIFSTNITSYFLCAKYAVKRMSTLYGGTGGVIVNVSSAASKGAIDTLTTGLALEVASEGIRVNAVRPGFVYTDMHKHSGNANRVNELKHLIPMKRGGSPEEVANAILWLMSDDSSYSTGTFIDLAGGK